MQNNRCLRLMPPSGVLDEIEQLPVPCHETMDWAQSPATFIDNLVGRVASVFGRIVLLGAFIDPKRERYSVPVSGSLCQCPIITDVIRRAHTEYVLEWLQMSLQQKTQDVSMYLESVNGHAQGVRNAILDSAALDILPIGKEIASDHLLNDSKLAVALVQTLALGKSPTAQSRRGSPYWSRIIGLGRRISGRLVRAQARPLSSVKDVLNFSCPPDQ